MMTEAEKSLLSELRAGYLVMTTTDEMEAAAKSLVRQGLARRKSRSAFIGVMPQVTVPHEIQTSEIKS